MIHREQRDAVTLLRLEHGKANALDEELLAELEGHLDELERSPPGAVVVTGTGAMFSAGVDLRRLLAAGADYTAAFVPALAAALRRLFACPLPVVAAVNGHAIAGGCILAAACDHRVMADGKARIGLTELAVGVPFPAAALEIMAALIPRHRLAPLVHAAELLGPRQALELGLVDELEAPADVLPRALAAAERLAAIPAGAFALTKRLLRQPALDRIDRHQAAFGADVLAAWQADATRASIRAFMERVVHRG